MHIFKALLNNCFFFKTLSCIHGPACYWCLWYVVKMKPCKEALQKHHLSLLSTEWRPLRDPNLARSLSSLQDPPQKKKKKKKKKLSLWKRSGDPWGTIEGPKIQITANFMEINGDRWAFVERQNSNHASLQRPLRVHWVLIMRSLRDQLRSLRNQLGPTEITEWPREFTKNVAIVERLLRDHW